MYFQKMILDYRQSASLLKARVERLQAEPPPDGGEERSQREERLLLLRGEYLQLMGIAAYLEGYYGDSWKGRAAQ